MSIYIRKKCIIPECNLMGRNKGMIDGKRIYGNKCVIHHKKKTGNTSFYTHIVDRISNLKCDICGWDKDICDRHRLNPEIGYTKENIKILCPNCHRLVTNKKLIL